MMSKSLVLIKPEAKTFCVISVLILVESKVFENKLVQLKTKRKNTFSSFLSILGHGQPFTQQSAVHNGLRLEIPSHFISFS